MDHGTVASRPGRLAPRWAGSRGDPDPVDLQLRVLADAVVAVDAAALQTFGEGVLVQIASLLYLQLLRAAVDTEQSCQVLLNFFSGVGQVVGEQVGSVRAGERKPNEENDTISMLKIHEIQKKGIPEGMCGRN